MAKLPGAPSGSYLTPKELRRKVIKYDVMDGTRVNIVRGLPKDCHPIKVVLVKQYDYHMLMRVQTKHTTFNMSINKHDLACGEAMIQDMKGHTIQPKPELSRRERRKRMWSYAS